MATSTEKCDTCQKSSLSILLLRPSPIAKATPLAPSAAERVKSDDGLLVGIVPARAPTESRYVLRLLRAGYVYVYIKSPPPGVKNWLVFRVTNEADLIPASHPLFEDPNANLGCGKPWHNDSGMKILTIPQAHKIDEIWIAYSANLWNDTLKKQNQANPAVMHPITLQGACTPNVFEPTVANLKSKVLECALTTLTVNGQTKHDYAFNSQATRVEKLAETLKKSAACHSKTKGKEIAVVLADPVAIAAELNTIRTRRHDLSKLEFEKPENAHPLNSSNLLMGLKKSFLDSTMQKDYTPLGPIRTKAKFESDTWPAGTEWDPLTPEERKTLLDSASKSILLKPYKDLFSRPDIGRVIYTDPLAWAEEKMKESWGKISPHFDDTKRIKWLKDFDAYMLKTHIEPLRRFEEDWWAATSDKRTLGYFCDHFDPKDPNDPKNRFCTGLVYASESQSIHTPAPITTGAVLDKYLTQLDKAIKEKDSVIKRALVGNQQSLIDEIDKQLAGDTDKEGMRDQSYDLLKGLEGESKFINSAFKKHKWIGDALAAFSVGQLAAISGAVLSAAARHPTITAKTAQLLLKANSLWLVQQTLELALHGSLSGSAPNMPVLITMKVDPDEALAVLRARQGQDLGTSKSRIKKLKRAGAKVPLTMLTDSDSIKAAQGSLASITQDNTTGSVKVGKNAANAAVAAGGTTLVLTEEQFTNLYAKQASLGSKAANAVRQSFATGSGADIRAITMTLQGRLAIGSIIVQAIGFIYNIQAMKNAQNDDAFYAARRSFYDTLFGLLAGLAETWVVVQSARLVTQLGATAAQQAAAKSLGIGALRSLSSIAGAVGGGINAYSSFSKAVENEGLGNREVAVAYFGSSFGHTGTLLTGTAVGVGIAAETLVARGIGGAVARSIAVRFGVAGGAALFGISITGIGLICLGVGLGLQVVAIVMTPTPLQRWVARSYFGRDDSFFSLDDERSDMFPKGNWQVEFDAFEAALKDAQKQ